MAFGLPSEGTRRLRLALGGLNAGGCLVAYVAVLALYGPPFWFGWWVIMAFILAGAFLSGHILAAILEWVIDGYRERR
jgi:hypothetical protein